MKVAGDTKIRREIYDFPRVPAKIVKSGKSLRWSLIDVWLEGCIFRLINFDGNRILDMFGGLPNPNEPRGQ